MPARPRTCALGACCGSGTAIYAPGCSWRSTAARVPGCLQHQLRRHPANAKPAISKGGQHLDTSGKRRRGCAASLATLYRAVVAKTICSIP